MEMETKKYVLLSGPEYELDFRGHHFHQIMAVKDFAGITAGSKGGFLEDESQLSHKDICWVNKSSLVMGKSVVHGNAIITGKSAIIDSEVHGSDPSKSTWIENSVAEKSYVSDGAQIYNSKLTEVCAKGSEVNLSTLNSTEVGGAYVDECSLKPTLVSKISDKAKLINCESNHSFKIDKPAFIHDRSLDDLKNIECEVFGNEVITVIDGNDYATFSRIDLIDDEYADTSFGDIDGFNRMTKDYPEIRNKFLKYFEPEKKEPKAPENNDNEDIFSFLKSLAERKANCSTSKEQGAECREGRWKSGTQTTSNVNKMDRLLEETLREFLKMMR